MQKVIEIIDGNRIVCVSGISGIGKSALMKEVCHYLHERDFVKDGQLYLGLKECPTIENLMKRWSAAL